MINREIKFRVWDGINKKMYEVSELNTNLQQVTCWDDNDNKLFFYFAGARQDCDLMQFTGLKDKNGKEIYEGDIFSFEGRSYQVYFDEARGSWSAINRKEGTDYKYQQNLTKMRAKRFEIIGNIYQNPELLN